MSGAELLKAAPLKPGQNVSSQATGSAVWTAAGPVGVNSLSYGLVSGRVSAVAVDPSDATGNHVFVGTTGGGLWSSQNAAASTPGSVQFVPVTDGLAALTRSPETGVSVGAVTVQPGATGVVLVGLGDPNDALDSYYGAGLLRSTDGGQTWTLIEQTMDLEDGVGLQNFSFVGEGFSGFAWSTTNVQLVVAAVSQAYEGTLVNAGQGAQSYEGLYWSNDGGATWHLARITDPNGEDVQGPFDGFTPPDGNAATAVIWNPVRKVFVAAVRYHGYYQSSDGANWTRMPDFPNGQPGAGLTVANCPTAGGSVGVVGCPIFRGSLAVNPISGDSFAWTVDAFNQDQGIWQDQCNFSGAGSGACANQTMTFGVRLGTGALEVSDANGPATIENGDYNLTLSAVPSGPGAGQDTLLFAGDNDLWKCSLANSCVWRNTTNATSCMSAKVGEYQHAVTWNPGNPLLMFVGTDSGLWRSADDVGETGSVCAATDGSHWQNLNAGLGVSGGLTEVESLGQSATSASTMLAGMGANGFAGVMNAPATAGDWNEILGGEGGPVAVDPTSHTNSWYASNGAGVSIFHCSSSTVCTPAAFGNTPVIGEAQVGNDGLAMVYPAEFEIDALDPTQLLVGTCRLWRGNATGTGWSASNAISPILDGTGGSVCNGNGLIRTVAARSVTGGEVIYVGMAGVDDGGGIVPGHVFKVTLNAAGTPGTWTDLSQSPVGNSEYAFNAFGAGVSAIYIDPHDATGGTVYVTIAGFSNVAEPMQQVYWTTDGGQNWRTISSNLPNAPANAVVVDAQDPSTVYVGLDTGVYMTRSVDTCGTATTSGGSCWTTYGTGLPLAPVTSLIATPVGVSNAILTAGTYGRGVWQIPAVTAGVTLTTATVSPTSLPFSGLTVGATSAAKTVTLKTTGTSPLQVSSVEVTGSAADFSETDTCTGASVAKNSTCVVNVSFTPTQAGSRTGTLAINANVAGGQLLVPLAGTGLATANVTLLPTSLSFGTQQVGTTSAAQTFNIQNVGGSSVSFTSATVSGAFKKVTSTCPSSLGAGVACAVTVEFVPTQAGDVTGSFTVVDSAGTQSAQLTGTGILGPTDTLSTTSLSFPSTVLGQTSAPLTVQITNSGGLPLTTIGTSVTGDFKAVNNCGGTLGAGASCGVSVTFTPTVAKGETGTLVISDSLKAQTVKLAGTGLKPPMISLSPASMNFGNQQINVPSTAKILTVSNTGGSPLAQPSFSFTGPGATSFSVGTTTCGASVAGASSCTVQVIFMPVAAGATTATLAVATSSPGVASAGISVSGTGLSPPMLAVLPAMANVGTVILGDASEAFNIQVTNSGQVAMVGPTFALSGISGPKGALLTDFVLSPPTDIAACTGTLNPGATCNIQVTFSPSTVGVESATLTVTGSNAIPPTTTVSLSGTGVPPIVLQASPVQLNFSATPVGTVSASLTAVISNVGRETANGLALNVKGPYELVPSLTTCTGTLAAISSCTVGLSFSPAASGDQVGSLTATVTNLGVAALVVPLDGSGVAVGGISPSPTQMTFGSVVVKTPSAAQILTVTNSGEASLSSLEIKVTGDYSLTGNTCPGTLAAAANCTVGVVFTPSTTGNLVGSVTMSSTSTGVAPAVVSLVGNGIPTGSLVASPAVANFGAVTVGQASPTQTITLDNTGATTLSGLQLVGAGDYSLPENGCAAQLASGATCTFTVIFSPGQVGTRIGSVTVQSTNAGYIPLVVGLTGTGLSAAQMVVTPTQLQFGSVAVGSNSTAQQLVVTNPGMGALAGLSFATGAPFNVGSGSCGTSLAAGGSCEVPVIFAPTAGGNESGTVTVSSTSLGVPAVHVAVSGSGMVPASLQLTPTSLTFSGTTVGATSPGQTVTVTNPGATAVSGLTLQASGDFATGTTGCTATLAAGGSCAVLVSFAPTVAGGRQGFLTVASTTQGVAIVTAGLSGTGLTPAVLTTAPTQLTYAATLVGQMSATQVVTITNSGQTAVTDLELGVTAGFQLDSAATTCTTTLAAGGNCTVGVKFAPTASGTINGSLTAGSRASGTAQTTSALTGTGALPPGITTIPAALVQFGTTGVGQAAQVVAVTVTNQGTLTTLTGLTVAVDATGTANGFGLSDNTCGTTLAVGASCTANVTFVPTSAGPLTGSLVISSSNGTKPVNLALAGIGFDFRFTIVGSASAAVVQGQTAYYTFAVTPLGPSSETSGTFNFQCGTLPANALCLFNPTQLQGLRATGNVTLGIAAGTSEVGANKAEVKRGGRGTVLLICGLLALPIAWKGRRARLFHPARLLLLALILAGVTCGVTSCASSGGSGGQVHLGGGTPTGSYTIPVTASSAGVTHSFSVTLVVN